MRNDKHSLFAGKYHNHATPVLIVVASLLMGFAGFCDDRLGFLYCPQGGDLGTKEHVYKDSGFAIKLVDYWNALPCNEISPMGGIDIHRVRCFVGPCTNDWFVVEYLAVNDVSHIDLDTWLDADMFLMRKIQLFPPEGISYKHIKVCKLPPDTNFAKKHGANKMASYTGLISIGEKKRRFFIACLNRGKEYWKIIKIVPFMEINDGKSEDLPIEMWTAGIFIGGFRLLSTKDCAKTKVTTQDYPLHDRLAPSFSMAMKRNDISQVVKILESGKFNPNGRLTTKGISVLREAAILFLHEEIDQHMIEILLKYGADPNQRDYLNISAFSYLVEPCAQWCAYLAANKRKYLAKGPRAKESKEYEAIQRQVIRVMPVIRLMLQYGANPNLKVGLVPPQSIFEVAIGYPDTYHSLVQLLIEGGAEITDEIIKTADKSTAEYLQKVKDGKIEISRLAVRKAVPGKPVPDKISPAK